MTLKSYWLGLGFLIFFQAAFSQQQKYDKIIREFVEEVKGNNVEKIVKNTRYPLYRKYPLPSINSEKEFMNRYDQVFDDSLKEFISISDIHNDWKEMENGIMLDNGIIWLDKSGKLIGVSYQSIFERKEWNQMVEAGRSNLYPDLQKFTCPILYIKTKTLQIRIDQLGVDSNPFISWPTDDSRSRKPVAFMTIGFFEYRFAYWDADKKQSDKPALTLTHGIYKSSGRGRYMEYIFKNGPYTYICSVTKSAEDDSPSGQIKILKDQQEILHEHALQIEGKLVKSY